MSVYNLRAYLAPFKRLPISPWRGNSRGRKMATCWIDRVVRAGGVSSWATSPGRPSSPTATRPSRATTRGPPPNEGFDALFPGFSDWGAWWQGEIAGEYFLSNSNLISHQLRVHLTPSESLGAGLIGYAFLADQPASFGSTSNKIATELDAYADWQLNSNFLISFVAAFATPQDAVEQAIGRTEDFTYGMIYVTYSY